MSEEETEKQNSKGSILIDLENMEEIEDNRNAKNIDDMASSYAVRALDGICSGTRQYLFDTYDKECDDHIKDIDVDIAIKNLEDSFKEWRLHNEETLHTRGSAIFLVDIVIACGILHEKLREP